MNEHAPKLGQLIDTNEQRDAIHIAVAPVEATEDMLPGEPIEWEIAGRMGKVVRCNMTRAIGIVDPFLRDTVHPGEHFWMFLKPGTITGLRHQWEHPAFDDQRGIAEFWLRDFAHRYEMDYDDMMRQVRERADYFTFGESIEYPPDAVVEQFRKHILIFTGVTLGPKLSFSCAC